MPPPILQLHSSHPSTGKAYPPPAHKQALGHQGVADTVIIPFADSGYGCRKRLEEFLLVNGFSVDGDMTQEVFANRRV